MANMTFPANKAFYEIRPIADFRDMLLQSLHLFGDRAAFKLKNKDGVYYNLSYKKYKKDVWNIGTHLLQDGFSGKKIGVMGANCYEWCVSYMAAACSGNTVVPIDKDLILEDLFNILAVSEMSAVFADKKSAAKLLENAYRLPQDFKIIVFEEEADGESFLSYRAYCGQGKALYADGYSAMDNVKLDPNALSVLLFTSGTTGMSKGVCLSQANICADIMHLTGVVKVYPDDQTLSVLPLHHTYECTLGFIPMIYSGACISFCEGLRYIMRNMQEVQPTVFITVPLMIEKMHAKIMKTVTEKKGGNVILGVGKLAAKAGKAFGVKDMDKRVFAEIHKTFGGRLRLFITGAAALDPRVAEDIMRFGFGIYIGYGLTECSPLVIGNHDRLALPDSVGTPLPGVEAKIENPDALGVGEICVRGPMVMLGYYNDEKSTREVLSADGWFKTGDLGTVDENNCYRITGRLKNIIVTKNGKNIFPEEVELYLNQSPMVGESMVFGKDDEENEDTVVSAKIFPNIEEIKKKYKNKEEISKEDIREALSEVVKEVNRRLPKYKKIMHFDVRETEFIKTTTQKIKRYANMDDSKKRDPEENK